MRAYGFALQPDDFAPYALMLPRGDDAFKRVVDATLTRLMRSSDIQRIYDK